MGMGVREKLMVRRGVDGREIPDWDSQAICFADGLKDTDFDLANVAQIWQKRGCVFL